MDIGSAFIAALAAAITINLLTVLALPVSTSQAIVGSIIAIGITSGTLNHAVLLKILLSWFLSPIGAGIISYLLYKLLGWLIEARVKNIRVWSLIMKIGFYLVGIYGAYTLGANNVANTTGIFVKAGMVDLKTALLVGSGAIALGVLTYSRGVMTTVGKRITSMSDLAALTATLAMDITVHIFTWVGVPVSTSQAIVGSVGGVGLVKSTRSIDLKVIGKIGVGWLGTIVLSLAFTIALLKLGTVIF